MQKQVRAVKIYRKDDMLVGNISYKGGSGRTMVSTLKADTPEALDRAYRKLVSNMYSALEAED